MADDPETDPRPQKRAQRGGKPPRAKGRPSKLTPEVHEHLVKAIEGGNYIETAVKACGIGVSTYYRWMEQGEAHAADAKDTPYRDLWEAVKKAEAEAETAALKDIRSAARDSWQAAAWYLERKFPARWGRKDRVEHTGKDGDTIKVSHDYDREVAELMDALKGQD